MPLGLLSLLSLRGPVAANETGRGEEADRRLEVIDDPLFAVDGVQMGAPIAELDALTELDAEEVLRGDKAARLAEEARLAREAQVGAQEDSPCCRPCRAWAGD